MDRFEFAADGNEHFVHVPDVTESTLSSPQSAGVFRSKFPAPGSNAFVGYGDATLREQILDISKAQSEAMVQPDGMADDLGWESVSAVAWCLGAHRGSLPVSAST